ncbi:MAG: heavy metal translocating P-type ATPase, partial [Acidobacteria bacterium]|nr:heavy metal translocating P-type ATPase [Acidobacteriota bacterium]
MKTSIIEVHAMLSVLSVDEVEGRIGEVPGVESVTVDFAAGRATVRYDETRLEVADIKSAVRQRGYEAAAPAAASAGDGHAGHTARSVLPAASASAAPETPPVTPATPAVSPAPAPTPGAAPAAPAGKGHEGHAAPDAPPAMSADMAHEMGHSGTDLSAMVRDMRNRFWICLIFTVPLFFYSPMGLFTPPAPPFGLGLDVWLFGFASLAIIYPSWPFFVS